MQLNDADSGRLVTLSVGRLLTVTLESNPTTGYAWRIVTPLPPALIADGEPRFVRPRTPGPRVGAPGKQVFRFRAVQPGEGVLRLAYERASGEPARTFEVPIRVP